MQATLATRRRRAAEALAVDDELVLIAAGEPQPVPGGADQCLPFRVHPDYYHLTDRATAGGVLAYDAREGWVDFVPRVTEDEQLWEGRAPTAVNTPLDQLPAWLAARRERSVAVLGAELPGMQAHPRSAEFREALLHTRRPKDAEALRRIRAAVQATAAGFAHVEDLLESGVRERELQIELEAAFFRAGGSKTAFDTIVGTGPNSAILHFPPSERAAQTGELVLIDSGATVEGYDADITRTFQVGGRSGFAAELYALVLAAQEEAIAGCRPGVEFRELHLATARRLASGLVELDVLRGSPDGLVEQDAHALFFPHGLGHLVGLGVRDASGYLPGRRRSERFGLAALRMDLPLEAGYVTTIEPGLYFIPPLLKDPRRRERYADAVNWSRVDELLGVGGVRIEDDVLVTEDEPVVLSRAIPK